MMWFVIKVDELRIEIREIIGSVSIPEKSIICAIIMRLFVILFSAVGFRIYLRAKFFVLIITIKMLFLKNIKYYVIL